MLGWTRPCIVYHSSFKNCIWYFGSNNRAEAIGLGCVFLMGCVAYFIVEVGRVDARRGHTRCPQDVKHHKARGDSQGSRRLRCAPQRFKPDRTSRLIPNACMHACMRTRLAHASLSIGVPRSKLAILGGTGRRLLTHTVGFPRLSIANSYCLIVECNAYLHDSKYATHSNCTTSICQPGALAANKVLWRRGAPVMISNARVLPRRRLVHGQIA